MANYKTFSMELAGRTLSVDVGRVGKQANGCAFMHYGDTTVLCTATESAAPRDGIDFFPLSVEYSEKYYAIGKIPGGFNKREGKPSENAILTSRVIDRPMRPLFPKDMRNDVTLECMVMSVDTLCRPELVAMIGASIATTISDIPFDGPCATTQVGLVNGEMIINPSQEQWNKGDLKLTVASTQDRIMMIEAGANEIPDADMIRYIYEADAVNKKLIAFINQIREEVGKPKQAYVSCAVPDEMFEAMKKIVTPEEMEAAVFTDEKEVREDNVAAVTEKLREAFADNEEWLAILGDAVYQYEKKTVRKMILKDHRRPDGRALDQIRPLFAEVDLIPRVHGSAMFHRGQTQIVDICTLAPLSDAQRVEGLDPFVTEKRYVHQYNFPAYSVGETKVSRGPGRREIGHGALAERALLPVLPSVEEFPYAIRCVSETMESNGSTSMASTCASCMALMAAGVPIKKQVAGISCGLVTGETDQDFVLLTDIQGLEDFFGDMDFKVTGTHDGITAIQMDIKIKGIDEQILRQALAQAYDGRMFILGKMLECMPAPNDHLSKYAPKIITFTINPEKISEVIGPRGKMINKIIADTGVKIDIDDDGSVYIATPDADAAAKARSIIEGITKELKVGDVFTGTVARIMSFGAFVEYAPGKDGMIHISKLDNKRVEKVEDVVKIGDTLECKVAEIDAQGRINLIRNDIVYDSDSMPVRRPPRRDNDRSGDHKNFRH